MRVPKLKRKRKRHGPKQHSELLLRLQLESNPQSLCLVRATLQRAAEIVHFQEPDSRAIVRSVDEALANVIRHAYQGKPGLPIEITCRRLSGDAQKKTSRGLEILLCDCGLAVDPKKLRGRPLEEIRPGGLGLHFIKQSMDVVEFHRKNGRNLLRMVKYVPPSQPAKVPEGE